MTECLPSPCPYGSIVAATAVREVSQQREVKGEDVLFAAADGGYRLYGVSDGHQGGSCAAFIKEAFWPILKCRLPPLPAFGRDDDTFRILGEIRKAVIEAFRLVDNDWYQQHQHSGATLTVVLVTGRLLTVANVGDSAAYVHDGRRFFAVTNTHRLEDNAAEKTRLEAVTHLTLAPLCASLDGPAKVGSKGFGPLRVWPGGLAVSRSIGDADLTPHVLSIPHVRQLLLPEAGARLVLASDGLWDTLKLKKVKNLIKNKSLRKCTGEMVCLVGMVLGGELTDDVSVTVVDILDPASPHRDFKQLRKEIKKKEAKGKKTAALVRSWNKRHQKLVPYDNFLADLDGTAVVPKHLLERKGVVRSLYVRIERHVVRGCVVFVGNLPGTSFRRFSGHRVVETGDIREDELEDALRRFGRIYRIQLKTPPRPPAFAFVEFEESRAADEAARKGEVEFRGTTLRIELARGGGPPSMSYSRGRSSRSPYRVLVKGLPPSASWQDVKDHFRKVVDPTFAKVYNDRDRLYGVVEFDSYDDLKYAIRKLDDTEFRNRYDRAFIRVVNDSERSPSSSSYSRSSDSRSRSRSRSHGRSRRRRSYSSRSGSRSRSRSESHSRSDSRESDRRSDSRSASPRKERHRSGSPPPEDAPDGSKKHHDTRDRSRSN